MMISPYRQFYKTIGYTFTDQQNLELALTHRSAGRQHNERLEYLGDAVLGMVIAKALFNRFPKQPEGALTRMRSQLVKGDTLAELGREAGLGQLIKLGPGEMKSGGHRRSSIIADAVEAVIGAIYLEAGLDKVEPLILQWFDSRLASLDPETQLKDPKTRLQEYLQGRKLPLPDYQVKSITGESHDQTFTVTCVVKPIDDVFEGVGNSRRRAEQVAASKVLESLESGK